MMSEDDDSWEVRAFEEDTGAGNLMGYCTWPPRSYTCTFCRREFRSSQALGGHMNVHRQDRARLLHPPIPTPTTVASLLIPTMGKEFVGNGVGLVHASPNHDSCLVPPAAASMDFLCKERHLSSATNSNDVDDDIVSDHVRVKGESLDRKLDLELRLGPR